MTLAELADFISEIIAECFPNDSVVWAEQYTPKHPLPQITFKLKDMTTPRHPINIVKDGITHSYYECVKILEINKYADSVAGNAGEIYALANTAVDDLTLFLLFLQSEAWMQRAYAMNLCIEGMGPVRDLSELDRTHYKYRAMQEYTVHFVLEYREGEAAVYVPAAKDGMEPVKDPVGYFENVEMEDKYE